MDSDASSKPTTQTDAAPNVAASATTAAPAIEGTSGAATAPAAKPTSDAKSTQDAKPNQPKPSAPPGASATTPKAAAKVKTPPPGFKFVKRRKEDGTFVTMMRKMTPEELEAAGQTEPPLPTPNTETPGVKYKTVMVRDANGAMIRVKRPIKPGEESSSKPTQPATAAERAKTDDKSKEAEGMSSASVETKGAGDDKKLDTTAPKQAESSAIEEPIDMTKAIAEQQDFYRKRRMHRMKGSLIRGFGTVLGSQIGHMSFDMDDHHDGGHDEDGGDMEDGDIIDSDQSMSDDDDDDDGDLGHDSHDHDTHDQDDEHSEDHADSSPHIEFNVAGAAGTTIKSLASTAASAPPKPAPTAVPNASQPVDSEKVTYKVTARDLEEMDKKAAGKDLERPLRHHWTNFSFYIMASLSIVLPLLFLVLAVFVFLMKDKAIDSGWNKMPDIIKVGVSAWPIVFAAVVAQVFKAYATWKVERGIRLIQLEQLVGSNSFASAVKQPMVLRQMDVLSLLLLLTWCLSPFGSQALQRSTYIGTTIKADQITVRYLNQTGQNKVFGANWEAATDESDHAADNQMTAIYFLSTLAPVDESYTTNEESAYMDEFTHPKLFKPYTDYPDGANTLVSGMGLPIVLSDTQIPEGTEGGSDSTVEESFTFNVTSSYFDFQCSNWSTIKGSDLSAAYPDDLLAWSSSKTMAMKFNNTHNSSSTINHLRFASANLDTGANITNVTGWSTWDYSFIQCDLKQKFMQSTIICQRTPPSGKGARYNMETLCLAIESFDITSDATVVPTPLEDFADDWTGMASPRNANKSGVTSTPTEMYAQNGYVNYDNQSINLAQETTAEIFAENFGTLFNTWIGVGYCPKCQSIVDIASLSTSDPDTQGRYVLVQADRSYSGNQVYLLSIAWIVCFVVCTVILLLAGIASVIVESITVAPDTLGYVSTVARNSRYLHVKPTSGAMTGAERARKLADTKVMIQDVKANAGVGKIALGLKSEKAVRLQYDRLYR